MLLYLYFIIIHEKNHINIIGIELQVELLLNLT